MPIAFITGGSAGFGAATARKKGPGAAETEFSLVRLKGDAEKAAKVYEGYQPLTAEDVADIIYYTASLPAHVCINDVSVTPLAQANAYYVQKSVDSPPR